MQASETSAVLLANNREGIDSVVQHMVGFLQIFFAELYILRMSDDDECIIFVLFQARFNFYFISVTVGQFLALAGAS